MKLIRAYVRDFMASKVVNALKDSRTPPISVMGATALGDEIGHQGLEILARVGSTHTPMAKIELKRQISFPSIAKTGSLLPQIFSN